MDCRQHYEFPAPRKGLPLKLIHLICSILLNLCHTQWDFIFLLLLLQSTELLLAIVDSKQEAFSALLPTLLRMGLPELLTDLIEGEVTAITEGTSTCGSESFSILIFITYPFLSSFPLSSPFECMLTGVWILIYAEMLYWI